MIEGPSEHPDARSVLAILGVEAVIDAEDLIWDVVTPESRHGLWRVRLPPGTPGPESYVVKCYHRRIDRFFDHRFRREERALNLLANHAPGLAPVIHGGAITEAHSAFLVLEDLGDAALHIELEESDMDGRMRLLGRAVDVLSAFHHVTDQLAGLFRALCYSSSLDRTSATTLMARFDVAVNRSLGFADDHPLRPAPVRKMFRDQVIAPLLASRRRVIHNSFSPLNLCLGKSGRAFVVDLETLSVGPAELDFGELVSFAGMNLGKAEDRLATRYLDAQAYPQAERDGFCQRVQLASLARSLDYAGTLTRRYLRFAREGLSDLAFVQLRRRSAYLHGAVERAEGVGLTPQLMDFLRECAAKEVPAV